MNNENASTGPTTSSVAVRFYVVPIERGPDRRKWKAPTAKGWNLDENAIHYPQDLQPGQNGGICHKQSGTCAIDIDNLRTSTQWFDERGLNLTQLMVAGQQIRSGKENSGKLLYALPPDLVINAQWPHSVAMTAPDGTMVLEFRCMARTGKTVHDVYPGSLHPQSNQPYTWYSQQYGTNKPETLPIIPQALLDWWNEENAKRGPRSNQPPPEWSPIDDNPLERNKITKALRAIGPDCSYEQWLHVGMALHHTGWEDEAFEIWHDWSMEGSSYANTSWNHMMSKWEGFGYDRGINLDYLYHVAHTQDPNWERATLELEQMSGGVTLDNDTGQQVHDMHAIMNQVTLESDAGVMEWACQHIALLPNRAEQSDWLRLLADRSRYNLSVLGPMLSSARRELALQRNTPGVDVPFVHVSETGMPLPTIANAQALATTYGFRFMFNLMSRKIETDRDLSDVPADVRELSHLTDYEDIGIQHGLSDQRLQKHRDRMAFSNSYHPFIKYLELEELINGRWDGSQTDWVSELAKSLTVEPGKEEMRLTLLKRWLVSAVAAAHLKDEGDYDSWEHKPKAPRGVLVLQGEQNMGKTSWFNSITPPGMYKEGLQINLNDMNHMKTATNKLIVEIGEAEHATKGRNANYMKTIIGRDVDEVRLAFQKEEVRMVRRNVFCATVNPAEFLTDDQNTRWWAIPITHIDFKQLESVDIKRMWQQVYHLWKSGEAYHLTLQEMALLNDSNEDFRKLTFTEEWLKDTYYFDSLEGQDDKDNWCTTTDIKQELERSKALDVTAGELTDILRRLCKQHKTIPTHIKGVRGRFWKTPALRPRQNMSPSSNA